MGAGICVSDGRLMVLGNCILHDVYDNIVVAPASGVGLANGAFIGVASDQMGSRRVFPVGKLEYVLIPVFLLLQMFPFFLLLYSSLVAGELEKKKKNCFGIKHFSCSK